MVKNYQDAHLQLLIRVEQNGFEISDYIRICNDSYSFSKSEISEKCVVYLFVLGLRGGFLRADLMSAYELGKFKLPLSELQLHASRNFIRDLKNLKSRSL